MKSILDLEDGVDTCNCIQVGATLCRLGFEVETAPNLKSAL